jgi:hypothetical protein
VILVLLLLLRSFWNNIYLPKRRRRATIRVQLGSNKDISHEKVKQEAGVYNRQNTDTYGALRE